MNYSSRKHGTIFYFNRKDMLAGTFCTMVFLLFLGGASPPGPRFSTPPADGRPFGFVLEHREYPPGRHDSRAPKDLPRSRPNRLRRAGSPAHPKCPGFAELSAVNHIVSTGTSSSLSVIVPFCTIRAEWVRLLGSSRVFSDGVALLH